MKKLFFIPLLFLSITSFATKKVVVESSEIKTSPGIGGNAQLGYAFAKGDIVTIEADASKQLERMLAYIFPEQILTREKFTKHVNFTFTMPADGVVVFRFISDRGGTNAIKYTITRLPASDETQNYGTKIEWQSPNGKIGDAVPVRVGQ